MILKEREKAFSNFLKISTRNSTPGVKKHGFLKKKKKNKINKKKNFKKKKKATLDQKKTLKKKKKSFCG